MPGEIYFYPAVEDRDCLHDLMCRVAWYFAPWTDRIGAVRLWLAQGLEHEIQVLDPGRVGIDPDVSIYFERVKPLLRLSPAATLSNEEILEAAQKNAALLFVWQWPASQHEQARLSDAAQAIWARGGHFYNVDKRAAMNEGSHYLWGCLRAFGSEREAVPECRARLEAFVSKVRHDRVYVFGTGPSLEAVKTRDFSDGDSIVSNSIVANREVLKKLKPIAVTACDPIFHAGCSQYAGEFRRHLREALEESDMHFFTVMRDYRHYLLALPPHLHDRVIALPFEDDAPFNFDIADKFYLYPAGNVLTLGLLPVAGSFYERITIYGCDGRPLEQNKYFWSHHKESQINDRMANIQQVHPGFFDRSYDDHYEDHCRNVAGVVDLLECSGKRVDCGPESYIPALKQRQSRAAQDLSDVVLVSVNPDAKDMYGHWVSCDDRLKEECDQLGIEFLSLGNQLLQQDIVDERPHYRKVFCFETYGAGNKVNSEISRDRLREFESTLEREAKRLLAIYPGKRLLFYMYTGSIPHAAAVYRVVSRFPEIRACVNTFWTCVMDCQAEDYIKSWAPFLRATARHPRFQVFAITSQLKRVIEDDAGVSLPLLPHPSPTLRDSETEAYLDVAAALEAPPRPRRILFPGGMVKNKGFRTTAEVSVKLAEVFPDIEICVRATIAEGSDPDVVREIESIAASRVHLVRDTLSTDKFVALIRSGDVIVLPYEQKPWRYRNSGLAVDALSAAAPAVCLSNTWFGDIVDRYNSGVTVEDGSAEAFVAAVTRIVEEYPRYRENAIQAGRTYLAANSWSIQIDSVLTTLDLPYNDKTDGWNHLFAAGDMPVQWQADFFPSEWTESVVLQSAAMEDSVRIDEAALIRGCLSLTGALDDGAALVNVIAEGERPFEKGSLTDDLRVLEIGASGLTKSEPGTETLGDVLAAQDIERLDVLRIDAPADALGVLRKVPWTTARPGMALVKFNNQLSKPNGFTASDLLNSLRQLDYAVYVSEWWPADGSGVARWRRICSTVDWRRDDDAWGDIIAFDGVPDEAMLMSTMRDASRKIDCQEEQLLWSEGQDAPQNVSQRIDEMPLSVEQIGEKLRAVERNAAENVELQAVQIDGPPEQSAPVPSIPPGAEAAAAQSPTGAEKTDMADKDGTGREEPARGGRTLPLLRASGVALISLAAGLAVASTAHAGPLADRNDLLIALAALLMAGGSVLLFALFVWHQRLRIYTRLDRTSPGLAFAFRQAGRFIRHRPRFAVVTAGFAGLLFAASLVALSFAPQLPIPPGLSTLLAMTVAGVLGSVFLLNLGAVIILERTREAAQAIADAHAATMQDRLRGIESLAEERPSQVLALLNEKFDQVTRAQLAAAQEAASQQVLSLLQEKLSEVAAAQEAAWQQTDRRQNEVLSLLKEKLSEVSRAQEAFAVRYQQKFNEVLSAQGTELVASIQGRIEDTAGVLKDLVGREIANIRSAQDLAHQSHNEELGQLREKFNEVAHAQETFAVDHKQRFGEALTAQGTELAATLAAVRNDLERLSALTGERERERSFDLNRYRARYQRFPRVLTDEQLDVFEKEWLPALDLNIDRRLLNYYAHQICLLEERGIGRFAGPTETMLARALVGLAVNRPSLDVLEIGTLFGLGAAAVRVVNRVTHPRTKITVIDPFEGYYGKTSTDPLTGEEITVENFQRNMEIFGVSESDYEIVQEFSQSGAALKPLQNRSFDVLIIDGDHTYAGVKRDFEIYKGLVAQSGFILFDDYQDPEYRNLSQFVDEEVAVNDGLRHVVSGFRTAVFRVRNRLSIDRNFLESASMERSGGIERPIVKRVDAV